MNQPPEHVTALRAWARGMYPLEAAVELLAAAFGGRFARPGNLWIRAKTEGQPGYWLDTDEMDDVGYLSGGEQRLIRIAASLAGGAPVRLSDVLCGNDEAIDRLIIKAVAHTAGQRQVWP